MKKRLIQIGCCILLVCQAMPAFASNAKNNTTVISKPMLRAAQIEEKYKMANGKKYKRRWNATKGKWVDPYWIPVDRDY